MGKCQRHDKSRAAIGGIGTDTVQIGDSSFNVQGVAGSDTGISLAVRANNHHDSGSYKLRLNYT